MAEREEFVGEEVILDPRMAGEPSYLPRQTTPGGALGLTAPARWETESVLVGLCFRASSLL
jgi:hypothetical protein